MNATFFIDELKSVASPAWLKGMERFDIVTEQALGVSMPNIRNIAKAANKTLTLEIRHDIAYELWESQIHEARILASLIEHPSKVNAKQMDTWANDFNSWDVCDQVCGNLFHHVPFFLDKAYEYVHSGKEFVKRCGFVLMVEYTVHHKKSPDSVCLTFLNCIEEQACDMRWFVRKAINWSLRAIGKRNAILHEHAIGCANRLLQQKNEAATWIARDALNELESEKVKAKLGIK